MTLTHRRTLLVAAGSLPILAACGSTDPLGSAPTSSGAATTITVGSANFPESEIIGELYAQALEAKGIQVKRQMQIGSREVYVKALGDSSIDLIGEYTGNLLAYFDKTATETDPAAVATALAKALPATLTVLDPAPAEDKDSYNVTKAFADKYGITSLSDLGKVTGPLRVGGPPELADRDYGPKGLTKVYGFPADRITFVPISDGGGPLTVRALANGDVDLANIFSTTPAIKENGFVTLADPKRLIAPQNVIPLMAKAKATPSVMAAINAVQKVLTTDDLLAMNGQNSGPAKLQPKAVAAAWLKQKGLV
jgi:osmoprotectant transport system substrate-binding protein